ncbi:MAG: biopolymer transporter ExbD [Planctomycetota bacterium]|nr:biopolymer transporter ExbD [Planctomycetota bacterium]
MATAPTAEQETEELPISVSNRKLEEGDLDITPMIDITFLLLIFFLVSSKMDQDAAVDLPPAKNGMGVVNNQSVMLILRKGEDRRALVSNGGGREFPLSSGLEAQEDEITKYVQDELGAGDKFSIIIKAEREVSHGEVSRVTKAAGKAASDSIQLHLAVMETH